MDDAGARVSLVVLDACRNNPFGARSLFRSAAKGLSGMDAPKGSLVAFATAPGSTAADGSGENGLYTSELIKAIRQQPDLEVEQLMKRVSARVQAASGGAQTPFRSSSLTGEFFFRAGAEAGPVLGEAPAMAALVGGLQVGVNALDAKVYVDGALKGAASPSRPLTIRDLPVGSATLRVEAAGHEPREQTVEIQEGRWSQARVVLARSAARTEPAQGPHGFYLAGSFSYSRAGGVCLAANPALKQVYIAGGMGQQGLIRVDAADPGRMAQTVLGPGGGGIAVDPDSGRYATTDAYQGHLLVFNADDTPFATCELRGCGGDLDVDPATGRFFVSTQCNDHVAVFDPRAKAILAHVASAGVSSRVLFDAGTGHIIENLTPNQRTGGIAPLVVDGSFGTSMPFKGFVQAVDGKLKRLYVTDNGSLSVLDSRSYAILRTIPGAGSSYVIADTALGRFYTLGAGNVLTTYDAATWAELATFTLPIAPSNLCMAPGDDRLYAVDGSRLYVFKR
jgi:DNA-binding beta-propeller fold protein YncE